MGTRERYEHGVFCYVELASDDAAAAKAFFEAVLGWTYDEEPDIEYFTARRDGKRVGAVFPAQTQPGWLNYVTVEDLDAVLEQVDDLGGTVEQEPYDVKEWGRAAVVRDPSGASLSLWQPKENHGAELVNAPGSLTWNDLQTTDVDAAATFYAELLGWEIGDVEGAPDERKGIKVGDAMNGGIAKLADAAAEAGVPSHWLPIFAVEDVDQAVTAADEAGGRALAPGMDIPAGRMAVLADPQGVPFAVFAGELDE